MIFDWMGLLQALLTLCAVAIAFAALVRNRGDDHDENTESRVRIEQGQHQLIADVTKLTLKVDELLAAQGDMQVSIAVLKAAQKRADERLDAHSSRLDSIEQAHYGYVSNHRKDGGSQ